VLAEQAKPPRCSLSDGRVEGTEVTLEPRVTSTSW
jgi:hypothetical protein